MLCQIMFYLYKQIREKAGIKLQTKFWGGPEGVAGFFVGSGMEISKLQLGSLSSFTSSAGGDSPV